MVIKLLGLIGAKWDLIRICGKVRSFIIDVVVNVAMIIVGGGGGIVVAVVGVRLVSVEFVEVLGVRRRRRRVEIFPVPN